MFSDSQEGCCLLVSRNITQSEWALIDSHSTSIIPKTGRFLTMHKRRRKRLTTRSLSQDPALLDDIHHGQVEVSGGFPSFYEMKSETIVTLG